MIRNGKRNGRRTTDDGNDRCRVASRRVAMNCVVRCFVHPFVRSFPRGLSHHPRRSARPDPSPFDRSRSIVRPRGRVSRFSTADGLRARTTRRGRSTDRRTDRRRRTREPGNGNARRVASNRNHHPSKRTAQRRLCCVPPTPFIHPFRVVSRTKEKRRRRDTARDRDRTFGATVRRTVFFAVVARLVSGMRPVFKARATMIIFVRAWIGVRTEARSGARSGGAVREIFNSRYTMGWCLSRTKCQILKRTRPRGCETPL